MKVSQWYCDWCKAPVDPTTFLYATTVGVTVTDDICKVCFAKIVQAVKDIRDAI